MGWMLRSVSCVFLSGVLLVGAGQTSGQPADDQHSSAGAINAFAMDLYGRLAKEPGNLFFSPYSIETALAMTYAGARGRTAEEMAKVLHLPSRGEEVHQAFGQLIKGLNAEKTPDGKPRGYELSVANALWGQKGYGFLPAFLDLVKRNYGAGLNEVDFDKDAEGARQAINAWVARETREKIKDIIQPDILDARTRLVLANAIYFKGNWLAQFKPAYTRQAPFHLMEGGTAKASMMNREGYYDYMQDQSCQVLKMPYVGREISMIVLLPRETNGLAELEKSVRNRDIAEWLSGLSEVAVSVAFPRFKLTSSSELNGVLAEMGMPQAFSKDANFSGMDRANYVFISHILHKAFVDVNEEGSEAAASTVVVFQAKEGAGVRMYRFQADHPFLFLIRHEKSGAVLFMGRVTSPEGYPTDGLEEQQEKWKK